MDRSVCCVQIAEDIWSEGLFKNTFGQRDQTKQKDAKLAQFPYN